MWNDHRGEDWEIEWKLKKEKQREGKKGIIPWVNLTIILMISFQRDWEVSILKIHFWKMGKVMLFFYVFSQMFLGVLLLFKQVKWKSMNGSFFVFLLFIFQVHYIYLIYSLHFSFMCMHSKADVLLNVWNAPEETAFVHYRINYSCQKLGNELYD